MLVLTRQMNEEIVIGDPANPVAVVRVVAIRGDRVRLGVEAVRRVEVHRREVIDQILADRSKAPCPAEPLAPTR